MRGFIEHTYIRYLVGAVHTCKNHKAEDGHLRFHHLRNFMCSPPHTFTQIQTILYISLLLQNPLLFISTEGKIYMKCLQGWDEEFSKHGLMMKTHKEEHEISACDPHTHKDTNTCP